MPVEWGILAAQAAGWAGATGAKLLAGTAWRDKVEPVFKKGDLAHQLADAYEAAFRAFADVLRASLDVDETMEARFAVAFEDDGFRDVLGQLPYVRFDQVDAGRARELFLGLGLPGATEAHFLVAWSALGKAFRERAVQKSHVRGLVETAQNERQEVLLERLAELVERRLPKPRDETATLTAYRRYVHELYRLADTRGLFWREKETTGENIRLAEVFVETLVQRRELLRKRLLDEKDRTTADAAPRQGDEDDEGRLVYQEAREEPRRVAEVLARERHLVILGPPGSGKSTLTRCLVLALVADDDGRPLATELPEETVPILLTLKTYAARLKNDATLKLDAFLRDEVGPHLPDLDEILDGERALVLLDGLDEVFDEAHRRWVSDEVHRLMSLYERARFVLTSRPHGYRAAPLPGSVPIFDMVAFDDERIGRFFTGWFLALARLGFDVERGRTAEQRAAELTRDVLGRPRIRALAENPMLCTLVVLVHRSRSGRLPERRVKFYEAAVAVLAEHWEKAKHSPKQEKLDFPEPELMVGVLSEVAWRAQTELEGREMPEDVLEEWMLDALADHPEWTAKRTSAVRDLLKVIRERTGLLVDAGGERYQFVHLSLQEYLVAFYLLDRLDDAACCRVVRHFLHAPEWEEILRLTVGAASRVRADALVRAILAEPSSEWEGRLRRDLRFVCRCLEDRPNVGEAVRAEVRTEWLEALGDRSAEDEAGLIGDGVGLGLTPETRAAVEAQLADDDFRVRRSAVAYFAQIGADDESTRAAVEARLADDDWSVRLSAVAYFAQIGADDESTRAAFEARLADDDEDVRRSAVEYFAKIGADDESTRAAFEARLADDDLSVRASAVTFFVETGLQDRLEAVLDAFAGGASTYTAATTDGKLSDAVGRFAATDDVLLSVSLRRRSSSSTSRGRFARSSCAATRSVVRRRRSTTSSGGRREAGRPPGVNPSVALDLGETPGDHRPRDLAGHATSSRHHSKVFIGHAISSRHRSKVFIGHAISLHRRSNRFIGHATS